MKHMIVLLLCLLLSGCVIVNGLGIDNDGEKVDAVTSESVLGL